jgi:hypothetical protein
MPLEETGSAFARMRPITEELLSVAVSRYAVAALTQATIIKLTVTAAMDVDHSLFAVLN